MALSNNMPQQDPGEIEALLPWHAAGTLNPRDARRVEEALARDPDLAAQYAVIREEYAAAIALNESLGAPSPRAMNKLFAAIDADPSQAKRRSPGLSQRLAGLFTGLSPRALAWSSMAAALALLLQAGVIGAMLVRDQGATFQTASLTANEAPAPAPQMNETVTRALVPMQAAPAPAAAPSAKIAQQPPRALIRFVPEARMSEVNALLDQYQASIQGSAPGGMLRLQFAQSLGKDEAAAVLKRMQGEKIVSLAVPTP